MGSTTVADLMVFIAGEPAVTQGLERVEAKPRISSKPEMWMLGSSEQSALYAAKFKLPYSFAHFIAPDQSQHCVALYHESCKKTGVEPSANLGVFVLCADTEQRANDLKLCRDLWRLRFESGDPGPCPSIEEAKNHVFTDAEKTRLSQRKSIAGTPAMVKKELEAIAESHQVGVACGRGRKTTLSNTI